MDRINEALKSVIEEAAPTQHVKISCGGTNFVIAYADQHGWCVYIQQPGAPKAQLSGKPFPTLKDAFISVATML